MQFIKETIAIAVGRKLLEIYNLTHLNYQLSGVFIIINAMFIYIIFALVLFTSLTIESVINFYV